MHPAAVDLTKVRPAPAQRGIAHLIHLVFGLLNHAVHATGLGGVEHDVTHDEALLAECLLQRLNVVHEVAVGVHIVHNDSCLVVPLEHGDRIHHLICLACDFHCTARHHRAASNRSPLQCSSVFAVVLPYSAGGGTPVRSTVCCDGLADISVTIEKLLFKRRRHHHKDRQQVFRIEYINPCHVCLSQEVLQVRRRQVDDFLALGSCQCDCFIHV
mmetsp:Transcript_6763/g.11407  ORF Transcript_6763/g.11407 Transcript_6763/m.11407 type:complete len:214 (-) Transcript_6763:458-1099(-)